MVVPATMAPPTPTSLARYSIPSNSGSGYLSKCVWQSNNLNLIFLVAVLLFRLDRAIRIHQNDAIVVYSGTSGDIWIILYGSRGSL